MNHQGTKIIETERLLLRPFAIEDAEAAYANWCSDEEVTKYLTWPTHGSISVTEWVIGDWVSHYAEPNFYQWAIVPKDLGQPIGTISVVEINEKVGSMEVGYCIGRKWWGKGIMTEGFSALLPFFFDEIGVNRISARHDANNPASGRVMQKVGLRYEGTLRKADWNNQGCVDVCYYGMLREEYDNRK